MKVELYSLIKKVWGRGEDERGRVGGKGNEKLEGAFGKRAKIGRGERRRRRRGRI